jgi:hypothetical protein
MAIPQARSFVRAKSLSIRRLRGQQADAATISLEWFDYSLVNDLAAPELFSR